MNLSVEEALRTIQQKAAVLRYLSNTAAHSPEQPDAAVLFGLGDVCADIEALSNRIKAALSVDVLAAELPDRERAASR